MLKIFCSLIYLVVITSTVIPQNLETKESNLLKLLGNFPTPPALQVDTLETVQLSEGTRYKIEFTAELPDTLFNRPVDRIKAYLFIPKHKAGDKLPAIVAIHQDGNRSDLGKLEPAGIDGSPDQFYGLELFKRGYVVICPDRFPHAERRRLENVSPQMPPMMQDISLFMKWAGQLILTNRTYFGKEVYDLERSVDILNTVDCVNKEKIGAIGHSAAGNILVYFMFVDTRIKVGVSSCGFFELIDYFNDKVTDFKNSVYAIPGLANVGCSSDYLAYIAPRPFLMTRGLTEYGKNDANEIKKSADHVSKTKEIEKYVRQRYSNLNANYKLRTIYFEGGHSFPSDIREESYKFIDLYLK